MQNIKLMCIYNITDNQYMSKIRFFDLTETVLHKNNFFSGGIFLFLKPHGF